MKILGKLAVLGAALAVSSSLAFADSLSLGSFGDAGLSGYTGGVNSGTLNNSEMQYIANDLTGGVPSGLGTLTAVGPTNAVDLNSNGVWDAAQGNSVYVGINANAGPSPTGGPNTTNDPAYGYYEFQTTFSAVGGGSTYNGSMTVLADDTTEVLLNGTIIVPFGSLGGDQLCADGLPTCTRTDTVSLNGTTLLHGTNTLDFIVEQAGNEATGTDPSGVDFTASLNQTPEPSSLMLLGTGLTSAAGLLFRRRRTA